MHKIIRVIKYPSRYFLKLIYKYGGWIPDTMYLRIVFYLKMGKKLNLKDPQTFNEKLQWLKLYNRKSEYTMMVDKNAVKAYVAKKIGDQYVIPTLGVWDKPEDIDWDILPSKFVLKTTHGGGNTGVVICKDKGIFDKAGAIKKLNFSMHQNLYKALREWPYKDVPHRIIAEEFIECDGNDLPDYKFFCFDGVVKALFVGTERQSGNVKFDYYDADFNHLDLIQVHPMSGRQLEKPDSFEKMKKIASKLSEGIPQVRIDLYNVKGKIYFGEMTFTHHGGLVPFHPDKWDYEFGSWIKLPEKTGAK